MVQKHLQQRFILFIFNLLSFPTLFSFSNDFESATWNRSSSRREAMFQNIANTEYPIMLQFKQINT